MHFISKDEDIMNCELAIQMFKAIAVVAELPDSEVRDKLLYNLSIALDLFNKPLMMMED